MITLKKSTHGIYKLIINGKPNGNTIESGVDVDHEVNTFNLQDTLFDIPCTALPDNVTFRFFLNADDSDEWLHITSITRKKNKLIVAYFTTIIQKGTNYLILNPYVLITKIAGKAKKAGMEADYVSEENANTVLFLHENTSGILRQKITKGRTIIINARKKAEQELVTAISKGTFVSKLKSTKFSGYLDLPW